MTDDTGRPVDSFSLALGFTGGLLAAGSVGLASYGNPILAGVIGGPAIVLLIGFYVYSRTAVWTTDIEGGDRHV